MISIVLPVYNGEDLLNRVLTSIELQSQQPKKIIIVNDGSTDKSLEIIQNFATENKNVQIINHEKNLGSVAAANTGFQAVKTKYVFKIDHDDYLENHCIRLFNECLKKNPNRDFYYGDYYELENENLKYQKIFHPFDTAANAILYKRSKLEEVEYYSNEILFAEYHLLLKLGLENGCYIDKPLYTYYRREGSLTKSDWYQRALDQFRNIFGDLLTKRIRTY